jgi:hypothetical protein
MGSSQKENGNDQKITFHRVMILIPFFTCAHPPSLPYTQGRGAGIGYDQASYKKNKDYFPEK